MQRYVGLDKLGRNGMALQGINLHNEGGRIWQTSGQIVVVPGQVFETELDMGVWVKDGYLADAPMPKPVVIPAPVVVPKPVVPAPVVVVAPIVLPKPVEPAPVVEPVVVPEPVKEVIPEPELPVIMEKEPEPKVVEKPVAKHVAKPEPESKKGRFGKGKK